MILVRIALADDTQAHQVFTRALRTYRKRMKIAVAGHGGKRVGSGRKPKGGNQVDIINLKTADEAKPDVKGGTSVEYLSNKLETKRPDLSEQVAGRVFQNAS